MGLFLCFLPTLAAARSDTQLRKTLTAHQQLTERSCSLPAAVWFSGNAAGICLHCLQEALPGQKLPRQTAGSAHFLPRCSTYACRQRALGHICQGIAVTFFPKNMQNKDVMQLCTICMRFFQSQHAIQALSPKASKKAFFLNFSCKIAC